MPVSLPLVFVHQPWSRYELNWRHLSISSALVVRLIPGNTLPPTACTSWWLAPPSFDVFEEARFLLALLVFLLCLFTAFYAFHTRGSTRTHEHYNNSLCGDTRCCSAIFKNPVARNQVAFRWLVSFLSPGNDSSRLFLLKMQGFHVFGQKQSNTKNPSCLYQLIW